MAINYCLLPITVIALTVVCVSAGDYASTIPFRGMPLPYRMFRVWMGANGNCRNNNVLVLGCFPVFVSLVL